MTWFRVGGAGIPASLKNAMNAVLNKKFGTSGQNYPPNGWPDDVNLLGPLPEKTVSGAIASFSDGADDVPISDCKFYFNPKQASGTPSPSNPLAISGWSGLNIFKTGVNLIDNSASAWENNGIDSSTGQNVTSSTRKRTRGYFPIMGYQNIIISGINVASGSTSFRFFWYDADKNYLGYKSMPAIPYAVGYGKARYMRVMVDRDIDISSLQIEYAETTASPYADYKSETKAVTWTEQGTIYGGSIDNSGVLTDAYIKINLWELPCTRLSTSVSGKYRFQLTTENLYAPSTSVATVGKCNVAVPISADYLYGAHDGIAVRNSTTIHMYDENYATDTALNFKAHLQEIGAYAVLPLRTSAQTTYQLSPLNLSTYYGDNNFWSEGDTSEVSFRADIDLLLATLQSSRSLSASLMRSSGPEERTEDPEDVSEPEENIQESEEQEGENDAR